MSVEIYQLEIHIFQNGYQNTNMVRVDKVDIAIQSPKEGLQTRFSLITSITTYHASETPLQICVVQR